MIRIRKKSQNLCTTQKSWISSRCGKEDTDAAVLWEPCWKYKGALRWSWAWACSADRLGYVQSSWPQCSLGHPCGRRETSHSVRFGVTVWYTLNLSRTTEINHRGIRALFCTRWQKQPCSYTLEPCVAANPPNPNPAALGFLALSSPQLWSPTVVPCFLTEPWLIQLPSWYTERNVLCESLS